MDITVEVVADPKTSRRPKRLVSDDDAIGFG